MSYARWGETDIYMFGVIGGGFECMCCELMPLQHIVHPVGSPIFPKGAEFDMYESFTCTEAEDMILHLYQHKYSGHNTGDAISRLGEEIHESKK